MRFGSRSGAKMRSRSRSGIMVRFGFGSWAGMRSGSGSSSVALEGRHLGATVEQWWWHAIEPSPNQYWTIVLERDWSSRPCRSTSRCAPATSAGLPTAAGSGSSLGCSSYGGLPLRLLLA